MRPLAIKEHALAQVELFTIGLYVRWARLLARKVTLTLTAHARTWLATKGYDQSYGARPLGRLIQVEIKDKLADEILFGRLDKGGDVTIVVKDGELSFDVRS